MAFSLAKLKFQSSIIQSDIHEAIRLINSSEKSFARITKLNQKNISDKLKIKNKKKIYRIIKNISILYKSVELDLSSLEKFVLKKGFSREDFVECLGYFEELKIWSISIDGGKLFFLN